jgi:hypothetical protein
VDRFTQRRSDRGESGPAERVELFFLADANLVLFLLTPIDRLDFFGILAMFDFGSIVFFRLCACVRISSQLGRVFLKKAPLW